MLDCSSYRDDSYSDAHVPRVAVLRIGGSPAFPDILNRVCNQDVRKVFLAFLTELTWHAHTKGRAVPGRKFLSIHTEHQQGLGMKSLRHVDAIPVIVKCEENDPFRLRRTPTKYKTYDSGTPLHSAMN